MSIQSVLSISFVALLLTACASQPLYSPASRPDTTGYWETRLTENRYRVTFTGRSSTANETVKNYAMLRAAELTVNSGYDWFEIVERDNENRVRDRNEPKVSVGVSVGRGCGAFGCGIIGSRWYTGVRVDPINQQDRYQTSLEILMGKGQPDDPNSVYDAKELQQNLRNNLGITIDK